MTAGRKDGQESRSSSSFERRDEVGASVVVYGGGGTGNDACCADFFLGKVQKRVMKPIQESFFIWFELETGEKVREQLYS